MLFREWLKENWKEDNIFPPAMSSKEALDVLTGYLLGEDWYIVNPISMEQANVEIVDAILSKYSRRYRKEVREAIKREKEKNK